jgi:hypothetical protein
MNGHILHRFVVGRSPFQLTSANPPARLVELGRSPVSWWQPVAGTALGLFLGSLIPPGTALGATISFFVGQGLAGVAIAGISACLGAGVVVLAAGLASLATSPPGRIPAWVTPTMTVVMSCCAAAALFPVPSFNFSQAERLYLAFVLPDDQWRWLALLYPAAAVGLAARLRPRRGVLRAGAASLITPVLAATVTAVLFFPHDHAAANSSAVAVQRVAEEQWWAATLAGLAVLIVLVLSRGVPVLARACVAAWLTTLLVGVERAVYSTFTGGWSYLGRLPSLLATPCVWLFYLAVLASCLALVRVRPPAPLKRPWAMPAAASATAAAAAVAVFTTGISGLFVPPVQPVPPAPLTEALVPPGVLTLAAARAVITRLGEALPDNWTRDRPASPPAGHSTITPAACVPFFYGQYLNMLPRPLTRAQGQYKLLPGFIDGTDTLKVVIASYARPVPAAMFAAAHRDVSACHRYTLTDPAGSLTGTVREVTVHGLPVPAWQAVISVSTPVASQTQTLVEIAIGHNLVTIDQVTYLNGALAQPDETVISAVTRAITPASLNAPPKTPFPAKAVLTQAAAEHIAGAVGPRLGSTWVPGRLPASAPAHVTYQPADCAALAHEDYLNVLPRPVARAENRYEAAPALPDDGLETLSVRVESFSQPVPASLLTAASRIFRACPRYTTQTSGSQVAGSNGPSFITTQAAFQPGLGVPAWRADISIDLDPGSASVTWIMITAGHNFLLISQQTISSGSGAQPDKKVITAAVTATVDALAHTMASQDPGPRTGS